MPAVVNSKSDPSDEFFEIVKNFGEKTEADIIAEATGLAEEARQKLAEVEQLLRETNVPDCLLTDAALSQDTCEGLKRAFDAYQGMIR